MSDRESFLEDDDDDDDICERLSTKWCDEIGPGFNPNPKDAALTYETALDNIELEDVLSVIDSILQDREVEA